MINTKCNSGNINNNNDLEQQGNESLLRNDYQESSKWQLSQPYNSKKHSTFVFLFQICYVIVVTIFIAVGVVSLVNSDDNTIYNADMMTLWKQQLYQQFTQLELSLTVNECVRSMVLFKDKVNDDVYFYSNEGKELLLCAQRAHNNNNNTLTYVDVDSKHNFNYTSSLNINFLNHKHKNMHSIMLNDIDVVIKENNELFVLKQLCIVINSTELSLEERYKMYKCNGFMPWYESYHKVNASEIGNECSYKEMLNEVDEVKIKVFDVNQLNVWKELIERKEDVKGRKGMLKGSGSVLFALGIVVLGFWMCFKEQIEKENKRVDGLKQQIQMETRKKQHFDSEDENEKNYYYGSDKEDNAGYKNEGRNI